LNEGKYLFPKKKHEEKSQLHEEEKAAAEQRSQETHSKKFAPIKFIDSYCLPQKFLICVVKFLLCESAYQAARVVAEEQEAAHAGAGVCSML
jgi:hypothetical protein